ncbi:MULTISPECIES: protein DpdE [unclassified Photobacterium]|uniref:protein DpdE n=1 Tax=unclassified Photobacterium TaxID=2628852 RepID=UPI001EE09AA1|nr:MULTISPECIES: protein DpdE [unclassified Photobacterium]MCG3865142.1 DEAD/DEAH box helicase [Photobacterium sp. Ph6]MCG3876550.1 DEAD/DEAH box helicase [Photobacterium sp. Ph5]
MPSVRVGSLVKSSNAFRGIGKIVAINQETSSADVGFFASPLRPFANIVNVSATDLRLVTSLGLNTEVFVLFPGSSSWKMGHYQGERPNEQALIYFSREMKDVYDFGDLFIPNAYPDEKFVVEEFLKGQGASSPFLCNALANFYQEYFAQRRSCRSISALLSSSVELEKHQLAAVYEVLKDSEKKYLLCDEVGLGKTIEAGFIIRQHVLERGRESKVLVLVPEALTHQWVRELSDRFHLGSLLNTDEDNADPNIHILTYAQALTYAFDPTMVVIDEAHQISSYPFNGKWLEREQFIAISKLANHSGVTLLLTGTPMAGHDSAYLALLHLLNANDFPLIDRTIELFNKLLPIQDRIRELSRIFVPENEDFLLYTSLNDLLDLDIGDPNLEVMVEALLPQVNMFALEKDLELRDRLIGELLSYLNNKCLFSYRMIRTSRSTGLLDNDVNEIENLFPGLNPVQTVTWNAPNNEAYLDEHFEQYRSEMVGNDAFKQLNISQFKQLVEALLTSPISFKSAVDRYLKTVSCTSDERSHWQYMLEQFDCEQLSKNKSTAFALTKWLEDMPDGKAVIFCGDCLTADNVYQFLVDNISTGVERHQQGKTPAFVTDSAVRVLVCDEKGEDGLNLQGQRRLAIHYSIPMEISRIEQRNGRLNRYSALSTGVCPIDTMILSTERATLYSKWVQALTMGVGCFSHYRANIQDEIDTLLNQEVWPAVWEEGYLAFEDAEVKLKDKTKQTYEHLDIIAKLATVDIDAEKAEKLLAEIRNDDEVFEESSSLTDWITEGILFQKLRGETKDLYRFKYISGLTKMRSSTLIDKCIVGLDIEASDYSSPVTQELSLSRLNSVRNGSYPLRYGQPFVDAIAEASLLSPLGNCSAIIRQIPIKQEPSLYFIPQWLVEGETYSASEQLAVDSQYPPVVYQEVFGENGKLTVQNMATLIKAGYSTKQSQIEIGSSPVPYQDTNITIQSDVSNTDVWQLVETLANKDRFNSALDLVLEKSKALAIEKFEQQSEFEDVVSKAKLLTLKYVLLIGS